MARESQDIYGDYGSVPTVSPSDAGVGGFSVQANPAAFGSQVGAAVQDVGKESTDLAVHFQGLYNDSTARDAGVGFSVKMGDLLNEYRQNKGLNAPNAYADFQKKSQDLYNDTASNLPNTEVQKMFKDQQARMLENSLKEGGVWAANQTESAQITSLNSSIANNINQFATTATNPTRRKELISGVMDDALQYSQFQGLDHETADKLVSHNVGEGYATLIKSTVQSDPELAKSLYQEAVNGGIPITRTDADGKKITDTVPYLDAAHRSQIEGEMATEFRRQEAENLNSARSYATGGANFDENTLVSSMRTVGRSDDYIAAQMNHLKQLQGNAITKGKQTDLNNDLGSDTDLALNGRQTQGDYTAASIKAAYPDNLPARAQAKDYSDSLEKVSGVVSDFYMKPAQERDVQVESLKPKPITGQADAAYPTFSAPVNTALDSAATKYNVPKDYMYKTTYIESHGDPSAKNPNGTSAGLMQFNDETAKKYGLTNKFDANASAEAGAKLYNDNKTSLASLVGRQPSDAEVYLAHQQGAGGAAALLNNPDDNAIDSLTKVYANNPKIKDPAATARAAVVNNGGTESSTGKEMSDKWTNYYNSIGSAESQYAKDTQTYQLAQSASRLYDQKLQQDPASIIMSRNMLLSTSQGDVLQDPVKNLAPYAKNMDFIYDRMGQSQDNRPLFSNDTMSKYSASVSQMPLQQGLKTIADLKNATGNYWPRIETQMAQSGNMSEQLKVGMEIKGEDDAHTIKMQQTMASAYSADNSTLKKSLFEEKDAVKGIQKALNGNAGKWSQYTSTISATNPKTGDDQVATFNNGVTKLAMQLMIEQHMSASQAATTASTAFTDQWKFIDRARIPKENASDIKSRASDTLDGLQIQDLAATKHLASTGLLLDPESYLQSVKSSGEWITNKTGDGLVRLDPSGRVVTKRDGGALEVPFKQTSPIGQDKPVSSTPPLWADTLMGYAM